ncbi:MBL fold metallo-hydrolase [soil metagenome]
MSDGDAGLELTVVGCAGSFAGPDSPASCYLLRAPHEGRTWSVVMDLGNGALGALQRHTDPLTLDAVLLSHLHADHCLDLTGLYVLRHHHPHSRPSRRLAVHGPRGTADRVARAHGAERPVSVESSFDFHDLRCRQAFAVGPFTVTPIRVNHPVESYGFRVEVGAITVAYTGDTDSCPELAPLMADADLVLADSAFVDGRDGLEGIHLSGSRAAAAAVGAGGVQRLMLTHLPSWNDPEVCRAQAAAVWPGEVELAEPGRTYPIG